MSKYKIFFIGERTYTAYNEQEAIRMAENHLANLPPQFKLDISAIRQDKYCHIQYQVCIIIVSIVRN